MTIPPAPRLRSYYDPLLWDRLAPLIVQHGTEQAQHMIDGRWKTLEQAREIVGYLRALDWVLQAADELMRRTEPPDLPQ